MMNMLKSPVRNVLNSYLKRLCKREYEGQTFHRYNERPIEMSFVFRSLGEIYPLKVLDVGTGTTALPYMMRNCGFLVTATDNVRDYWPAGMINRHYHVIDDDITSTRIQEKFDLITCISVLEHIEKFDAAVRNMFSLLNPKGHLILTFPYSERQYVKNVYDLPGSTYGRGSPFITQSYSRSEVDRWMQENNGSIVLQEYWQFWDGDYWTVGNQVIPPKKVDVNDIHQVSCLLIQRID